MVLVGDRAQLSGEEQVNGRAQLYVKGRTSPQGHIRVEESDHERTMWRPRRRKNKGPDHAIACTQIDKDGVWQVPKIRSS